MAGSVALCAILVVSVLSSPLVARHGGASRAVFTPAQAPSPYAPNQIDLGMDVANLTISHINFFDTGGDWYPKLDLTVSFSAWDPQTNQTAYPNPDSSAQGGGCAPCGMYPFAFASAGAAGLTITLQDDQRPYGGNLYGVSINGGSYQYFISVEGTAYGPQTLTYNGQGQSCVAPSGCTFTISGNQGKREAAVTFTLTVETALLYQTAGQLAILDAFENYLTGLETTNLAVICPSTWQAVNNLVSPQEVETVILIAFSILTLGPGTAAAESITDIVSSFIAHSVAEWAGDYTSSTLYGWGNETGSYYPAAVGAVSGLINYVDSQGLWFCPNIANFWSTIAPPVTSSFYDTGSSGLLGATVSDLQSYYNALQGGSVSQVLSNLSTEINEAQQTANFIPNIWNSWSMYNPGGSAQWCMFGVNGNGQSTPCYVYTTLLWDQLFSPLWGFLNNTITQLYSDQSALSDLKNDWGIPVCGATWYAGEGIDYTPAYAPLAVSVQGGIGPYGLSISSGPAWASLSSTSPTRAVLVGQAPTSPSTTTMTFSASDDVGDSARCSVKLVVQTSVTFTETGFPSGTLWYVNITGGPSLSSTGTTLMTQLSSGTYGYTVGTVRPGSYASGGSVTVPANGSVFASVSFVQVSLLNGYAAEVWNYGTTYKVSFTVPSGVSHELFVWDITDSTATPTITTPTGLTPVASTEFSTSTGIAFGALAAGSYSVSIAANSGWVNTVSMAVYGISNDNQYSYQFAAVSEGKSLALSLGGSVYIGVLMTGGIPITAWSLTTINEEAATTTGGYTGLIGQQTSNTFSMTTAAAGYGIAGVALLPVAPVQLLNGYANTPWENGWSYTFKFTVPSGLSHELFLWTFNDNAAATVSLPVGLTVEKEFGNSTGIALGSLAPGTYSASFNAGSGWVNTVSMAAYGISNDNEYSYQFAAGSQVKTLTMNSGGSVYLGVFATGGIPITNPSLTTISEKAWAPPSSPTNGTTDLIGFQSSNVLSFTTTAAGYGIAAAGIYYVG